LKPINYYSKAGRKKNVTDRRASSNGEQREWCSEIWELPTEQLLLFLIPCRLEKGMQFEKERK